MRRSEIVRRLTAPMAAALLLGAVSCASDECMENRSAVPMAGFWSSEPVPRQVALDSIEVYGVGAPNDSVLIACGRNVKELELPFRIDQGETTFSIRYLQKQLAQHGMHDDIVFEYEALPWFISDPCGVGYRYRIKDIRWTDEFIDSVRCTDNLITNTSGINIRIYFRTTTDF